MADIKVGDEVRVYVVDAEGRVLFPGNGAFAWSVQDAPAIGAASGEGVQVAAHFPVGPYMLTFTGDPAYDGPRTPTWTVRAREATVTWHVIQYVVDGQVRMVDVRPSVPSKLICEENGHTYEVRVLATEMDWVAADKLARDLRARSDVTR